MPEPEPASAPPAPLHCLNCQAALGLVLPNFCPACGQKTRPRPPTLREFAQQFGGTYISTEGALWRSLRLLLLKPGGLTLDYLAGRRRHYVLPLRLYLTVSVLVLLVLRLMAAADVGGLRARVDGPLERPQQLQIDLGLGRAGLKDGVYFCHGLPGWLCRRLQARVDVAPAAMAHEVAQVGERMVAHLGAGLFVLLPGFALWLKLAYLGRRRRTTEHPVFALHVHTFWSVMQALTLPGLPGLTPLAALAVPAYTVLAMRRVYGGRWWPTLARAAAISTLYGFSLALTMAGLALWAFLF